MHMVTSDPSDRRKIVRSLKLNGGKNTPSLKLASKLQPPMKIQCFVQMTFPFRGNFSLASSQGMMLKCFQLGSFPSLLSHFGPCNKSSNFNELPYTKYE